MHIANYLGLLQNSEQQLTSAFEEVAQHHKDEPDIRETCLLLADWSRQHCTMLHPFVKHYNQEKNDEPERLLSRNSYW